MGQAESKELALKPVVVVVGGGYGGTVVAKELDATENFNVVLIDRKDYFLHSLACLRAAVETDWAERIMIPYNKLLRHGTVVHGEVVEVGPDSVIVHGRDTPIMFNYLVIATGTSYAFPGKIALPTREESVIKYHNMSDLIQNTQRILIIGGGPVGVELAGEILETFPDKEVTIVHSQEKLIGSGLSETFMIRTEEQLRLKGCNLILGEKIDLNSDELKDEAPIGDNYVAGTRTVKTNKGTEIETDIIFICTGTTINNRSFTKNFSELLNEEGRIKVNKHFQVEGVDHVFAIGDCCNMECKMAYYAAKHGSVVAQNIARMEKNKTRVKRKKLISYKPAEYPVMFVSIGASGGVAQLPIKKGTILGATLVSMIKSKSLFTARYWNYHNQPLDWHNPNPDTQLEREKVRVKRKNLAVALDISEEEAHKLIRSALPIVERQEGDSHT